MPNSPCGDSVCVTVDVYPAELEKRNRLLGHTLSHERRKVEAAIDFLMEISPDPPGMDIPTSRTGILPSDGVYRRLWSDYLDRNAKEQSKKDGAPHA
jgi:hypothetical protein